MKLTYKNYKHIWYYLILASVIYLIILWLLRVFTREKTIVHQIQNKRNADELLQDIEKHIEKNETSFHKFYEDMPENIRQKIDIIDSEILQVIGSEYSSIPKMNEVYMTANKTNNSDKSFVNLHTDAPFYICDTYRVLICIKANGNVTTHIPPDNYSNKLNKYDVLGFDYSKTLHYIDIDESSDSEKRMLLKLHYAKTDICNKVTRRYTRFARQLFIDNLNDMGIRGYLMIIGQFLFSYLPFVILFYCVLFIIYSNNMKNNIIFYTLSTVMVVALSHIAFQSYFLINDF
jgi:predicted small metal-binding protein